MCARVNIFFDTLGLFDTVDTALQTKKAEAPLLLHLRLRALTFWILLIPSAIAFCIKNTLFENYYLLYLLFSSTVTLIAFIFVNSALRTVGIAVIFLKMISSVMPS